MLNQKAPSASQWQKLYQLADDFNKLAPWDWMYDSDLFAVVDPETGETLYCCIMGAGGELFAMAVYRGECGWQGYREIANGRVDDQSSEAVIIQHCLMVSFEDHEYLNTEDRASIKQQNLRFRGAHAYPQFRSYIPGFVPWHLENDEADLLIVALEQALDVAARFEDDVDLLYFKGEKDAVLTRVPEKQVGKIIWHDEKRKLFSTTITDSELASLYPVQLSEVDKNKIAKLKNSTKHYPGAWEIDYDYAVEMPIQDKKDERPYFPKMLLVADRDTGFVLAVQLLKPKESIADVVIALISSASNPFPLPHDIYVKKQDLYHLLQPVASMLDIKLSVVKHLPAITEIRESLRKDKMGGV